MWQPCTRLGHLVICPLALHAGAHPLTHPLGSPPRTPPLRRAMNTIKNLGSTGIYAYTTLISVFICAPGIFIYEKVGLAGGGCSKAGLAPWQPATTALRGAPRAER